MIETTRMSVLVALCIAAIASSAAWAEEEESWGFSGGVTLTSDYPFRGISQTDNKPAVQGNIDFWHESGIYAGVWGSALNFGDGDQGYLEADLYAGYGGEISGFSYDLAVIYYWYPGTGSSQDYNYLELGVGGGYDLGPAAVSAQFYYSPDFFASSGTGIYLGGGVSVPIPGDLPFSPTIDANVGYQWIDDNDDFGTPDYLEWNVGLGLAFYGLDLDFRYHDTDLSDGECFGGLDVCDPRFVFSVSKSF
ncbi:MAG: TorF family putative porin [Myxococcota bacterium]|nr:TorF family putative porin [Myxococcota bacterium]